MKVLQYSKNQPNNGEAWNISEAVRKAQTGGDPIDHGLSIMQQLEAKGYGLVKLPPCPTCNDNGAVGMLDRTEPCPTCTPPNSLAQTEEKHAFWPNSYNPHNESQP